MTEPVETRRVYRDFTPEERAHWEQAVRETEAELPRLMAQLSQLRAAAAEPSLSGQLRRAVHSATLPLPRIADRCAIDLRTLGAFLRGEATLPSDVMDRLAEVLGDQLAPPK